MTDEVDDKSIRPWRLRDTHLVLDNPWAKVRCDTCELGDGSVISEYFYWEGGDFAQVFALTPREEVILTRQYKHGVKEIVIELPAGLIDAGNELPLVTAQRELQEETGFSAAHWQSLGLFNVSAAKATTRAHLYLATNSVKVLEQRLDRTERIEVMLVGIDEMLKMVQEGVIKDLASVAATFLALPHLGRCP